MVTQDRYGIIPGMGISFESNKVKVDSKVNSRM